MVDERHQEIWDSLDEAEIDAFVCNGYIDGDLMGALMYQVESRRTRPNVGLFLTTYGGSPDEAYGMMRRLKRIYEHVTVYVFGMCKSAGTLAALGADEIVMSEQGELGPLDIQVRLTDELDRQQSSLTIFDTLAELSDRAFVIYEENMLRITRRSFGAVSFKTASDISLQIVNSIISPLSQQVDPERLGEMRRRIQIARAYGTRLGVDESVINRLTHEYPSHGFKIDLEEAAEFLPDKCRPPTIQEYQLAAWVTTTMRASYEQEDALRNPDYPGFVFSINPPLDNEPPDDDSTQNDPDEVVPVNSDADSAEDTGDESRRDDRDGEPGDEGQATGT